MINFLILIFSSIISISALASPHRIGNGGSGIVDKDRIYLLDLAEAGVEDAPFFNYEVENKFADLVNSRFSSDFPKDLIAIKLSEIHQKDALLASSIAVVMQMMNWNFVNTELEKTDDVIPAINYPVEDLVQLAVRRHGQILLHKPSWDRMSKEHQAALVIHEMIYLLARAPYHVSDAMINSNVRSFVGTLFTTQFKNYTTKDLNYICELFPCLRMFQEKVENILVHISPYRPRIYFMPQIVAYNSDLHIKKNVEVKNETILLKKAIEEQCSQHNNILKVFSVNYYELIFNLNSLTHPGFIDWMSTYKSIASEDEAMNSSICDFGNEYQAVKNLLQIDFPLWKID